MGTETLPDGLVCPLCGSAGPFAHVSGPQGATCCLCDRCLLIFRPPADLPPPDIERARYLLHCNSVHDAGYVAFLRQAVDPTLPYLRQGMRGLDYGCGPAPALCLLRAEVGLSCDNYDPFFFPDMPAGPFDFLFATEVVEHLHHPAAELPRMVASLRPGGVMTLMTSLWTDVAAFAGWSYAMDFTHVCFYHAKTIDVICRTFGLEALNRESPRVAVLRRTV